MCIVMTVYMLPWCKQITEWQLVTLVTNSKYTHTVVLGKKKTLITSLVTDYDYVN